MYYRMELAAYPRRQYFTFILMLGILAVKSQTVMAQTPAASGSDYASGEWRLETKVVAEITANFDERYTAPHLVPSQWLIAAGLPPKLTGQEPLLTECRLQTAGGIVKTGTPTYESGPFQRSYMRIVFPASASVTSNGYSMEMVYQVRMSSRHLIAGKVGSPSPTLTTAERAAFLAPTRYIRWSDGQLRDWMREENLVRKSDERAVPFAWRVAQTVHNQFKYGPVEWDAAKVCATKIGDCAGISSVIVGILRANGIPARLNLGFWVADEGKATPGYHVRLEFFSGDNGGWIPVDGSGLVSWGTKWASAFGHEDGAFLALQVDTDVLVDTSKFGIQPITQLQVPSHWALGSGNFTEEQIERSVSITRRLLRSSGSSRN